MNNEVWDKRILALRSGKLLDKEFSSMFLRDMSKESVNYVLGKLTEKELETLFQFAGEVCPEYLLGSAGSYEVDKNAFNEIGVWKSKHYKV